MFLLRPDIPQLRQTLEVTDPEYLIHIQVLTANVLLIDSEPTYSQHNTQQLLLHAIAAVKANQSPMDGNALDVSISPPLSSVMPTYGSDLDSILRCHTRQEVYESELRRDRGFSWS